MLTPVFLKPPFFFFFLIMCCSSIILFACNKLMWQNLIRGCKIDPYSIFLFTLSTYLATSLLYLVTVHTLFTYYSHTASLDFDNQNQQTWLLLHHPSRCPSQTWTTNTPWPTPTNPLLLQTTSTPWPTPRYKCPTCGRKYSTKKEKKDCLFKLAVFFFFFDNSKQTPLLGDRTLDVSHGRRQEVPLGYKGLDTLIYKIFPQIV